MWKMFWVILFYGTFASFGLVSFMIAWKGVEDLKQLFARLRQDQGEPKEGATRG